MGKQKRPPGHAPPQRASGLLKHQPLYRIWARDFSYPGSISAFPVRGYSIAEDVVRVNTLMQSPLVVAGRPLNAWEGYNYKSSPKVTGCRSGGPANWQSAGRREGRFGLELNDSGDAPRGFEPLTYGFVGRGATQSI